jgi:hypothetical protein
MASSSTLLDTTILNPNYEMIGSFSGGQNMDYLEKANKSFADGFKQ